VKVKKRHGRIKMGWGWNKKKSLVLPLQKKKEKKTAPDLCKKLNGNSPKGQGCGKRITGRRKGGGNEDEKEK